MTNCLSLNQSQLERLRGKKLLHIVGEYDKGHWIEGGEEAWSRCKFYAFNRFKPTPTPW